MKSKQYKSSGTAKFVSLMIGGLMCGATIGAASGQESLFNGQPIKGTTTVNEAALESRLDAAYNEGLIDPLELANMRRDLDAIRVKEEAYRMNRNGLNGSDEDRIQSRLTRFSHNLDAREARRGRAVASVVYVQQ